MPIWFRSGFYGGLGVTLLAGFVLLWLWQPERQVQRHTANFFRAIEHKNWERMADFVAGNYQDQWGHDRARVLERAREVFRYLHGVRIVAFPANVRLGQQGAQWTARVTIEADDGEIATLVKERINSVATPFELEWHRLSAKPWDWKLVRVSNSDLEIPAEAY